MCLVEKRKFIVVDYPFSYRFIIHIFIKNIIFHNTLSLIVIITDLKKTFGADMFNIL